MLTKSEIQSITSRLPDSVKDDINWQINRVKSFASKQMESVRDFHSDEGGSMFGQKSVAVDSVGC